MSQAEDVFKSEGHMHVHMRLLPAFSMPRYNSYISGVGSIFDAIFDHRRVVQREEQYLIEEFEVGVTRCCQ